MRFSSNEDFIVVVDIMRSLGLPMREGGPSQKQVLQRLQESPSPAPLTLMSSSPAMVAGSHTRQTSASSSAIHDRSSSRAGLPQYADFKVPERPATADSLRQTPGSSQVASGTLDSFANSSPLSTPSQARAASFREPTRPLYLSQQERETYIRRPSQPLFNENATSSASSQMKPSFYLRQLQENSTPGSRLFSKSTFFPILPAATGDASNQSSDPFRADSMPVSREDVSSNVMIPPRTDSPISRPSFTSTDIQDMMIPPRRQLPFDRPVSTPADLQSLPVPPRRELAFSPPDPLPRSSSAVDLPPLPKPTPVTKSNPIKPAEAGSSREPKNLAPIKRVAQRKAPAPKAANPRASSPLKTVTRETTITPPARNEDAPSPLAAKSATASRPTSAASGLVSKASAPITKRVAPPIRPPSSAKRPKMIDQSTQTQTLSGRDHTAKERVAASHNVPEGTPAAVAPTASGPPQSFLNDLDTFVAHHKNRPAPKELWQKPGYAEADVVHRQMMLNDFICQNLENADFLQLCADTEVAWRRIGLGM
ncbi:hypothetical protein DL98DRAFT_248312 [Cadophora sp. DSE1049]|nr:hypothetical protein DL98DRAFT_248312 [Cadophora sp. DSE1049]